MKNYGVVILLVGSGVLGGFLSNMAFRSLEVNAQVAKSQPSEKQEKYEKVITANKFAIKDAEGNPRIVLAVTDTGMAGIYMFDKKGMPKIMLLLGDENPSIMVVDQSAKRCLEIFGGEDAVGLRCKDKNEVLRTGLGVFKDNGFICVNNKAGKPVWWAP